LSFTTRLAREHGWSIGFARTAILEYMRFCFLAAVSSTPVTPSEHVDAVWHLHLTYSRDYWDVWCKVILQTQLHHDPTQGGVLEQRRYRLQYAATLAVYERFFGAPPELLWPATHRRFGKRPRFRILDTAHWVAVPRPWAFLRRLGRSG
jgi:hypothetical protein